MPIIATGRFEDCVTELTAEIIRVEVVRFAELLHRTGVQSVTVWCSFNPDLPEDSMLQAPERTVPPHQILDFLDIAVRHGVWAYGDNFSRAGVDALDGSFRFLLGNDKDIQLNTQNLGLLDATRSAWIGAGYEVHEDAGKEWVRINPPSVPK